MTSMPRGSWEGAQEAELGFWVSYLRAISSREVFALSRLGEGDIRLTQQFWVPRIEGRLLDVGCSPISVHEGRKGVEVVAIDPLMDAFCRALPVFARLGKVANVEYRCCKIQDVQDETFDVIWCVNVLDHTDDWQEIVAHFKDLLLPGGLLLLGVDVRHSSDSLNQHHISQIREEELLAELVQDYIIEWHTPYRDQDCYYFVVVARRRR